MIKPVLIFIAVFGIMVVAPLDAFACSGDLLSQYERSNGKTMCITDSTAQKLMERGWEIMLIHVTSDELTLAIPDDAPEIDDAEYEMNNPDDDLKNNNEILEFDYSAKTEFVDDGRESHWGFQKAPAPTPLYDAILDLKEEHNIDESGLYRTPHTSHELYSINEGVGFYPEDWMPGYIPDGYKLLYFVNEHFVETTGNARLSIIFVPSTFELNQNTTSFDIQRSDGFRIGVSYKIQTLDEIEDIMEGFRDILESQPNYEGRWLDIQRDGKTVWASETQTHHNHYQAGLTFHPTENISFSVTSHYHTLEELIPIFNSVMN